MKFEKFIVKLNKMDVVVITLTNHPPMTMTTYYAINE